MATTVQGRYFWYESATTKSVIEMKVIEWGGYLSQQWTENRTHVEENA